MLAIIERYFYSHYLIGIKLQLFVLRNYMLSAALSSISTTSLLTACCKFRSSRESLVVPKPPEKTFEHNIVNCSPSFDSMRLCACLTNCARISSGSLAYVTSLFSRVTAGHQSPNSLRRFLSWCQDGKGK